MLSYVRHIDSLSKGTVYMLKYHLRCHATVPAHLKRIFLIPLCDFLLPLLGIFRFRPFKQLF